MAIKKYKPCLLYTSSGDADLIYGDGTAVADFRNVDGGDVLLFISDVCILGRVQQSYRPRQGLYHFLRLLRTGAAESGVFIERADGADLARGRGCFCGRRGGCDLSLIHILTTKNKQYGEA